MTPGRALLMAALLGATPAARAFVRDTTDVNGDPASGRCLWWGTRQVTFQVNATSAANPPGGRAPCPSCTPCGDPDAAAAMVAATLPTWNAARRASTDPLPCTDLVFTGDGTTTSTAFGGADGLTQVFFRSGACSAVAAGDPCLFDPGACAAKFNCWEHGGGTIGLTTTTFRGSTGEILGADVEFNGWDGGADGYYLTCGLATDPACVGAPPHVAGCTSTDVATLALHEAGHVLGLDHTCQYAPPYDSCTPDSVMQPAIPNGSTRRALDADDVEGICTIYPRGAATLTCGSEPVPAAGGCGCSAGGGGVGLAWAVLAALGARRRRG